jgi:presenilin-like A22 family membrane protease
MVTMVANKTVAAAFLHTKPTQTLRADWNLYLVFVGKIILPNLIVVDVNSYVNSLTQT